MAVLLAASHQAAAQTGPAEPYKLGAFRQKGRTFLGVVLGDTRVIDLEKANATYAGRNAAAKKLAMPSDMIALINRFPWAVATERLSSKDPARPVGRAATGRAARHFGDLIRRSQVAGNADKVLHHGE